MGMDACARSEVYRRVSQAARAVGESFTGWLLPDPDRLRYRVDAGQAGWVMPYALEPSLASQAEAALTELAVLYVGRNRRQLGEEAYDALLLNAPASAARLGEPAYGAPHSVRNPAMARALERSARIMPGLDASVLLGWWGADSHGRPWLASLTKLFVQAVEEMDTAKVGELTPVMLQWALYPLHAASQKALAPFEWSAAVRQEIEAVLQIGLHLSHHLVRSRVAELRPLSDERYDRLRWTWDALLSPRLSFAGQLPLLGRCRFYPLELATLGDGARDLTEILDDHGSEAAADKLRSWLGHDRDLARRMSSGLAASSLRELLVQLLACGPAPGGELFAYLHALLRSPSGGEALLDDKNRRKEACRFLEASTGQAAGSALAGQLAGLATRLKRHNPKHPARVWLAEDEQGQRIEQSLLAAAGDVLMDRVAGLVRQRLVPRQGDETDRSLGELYDSGRLYRFGPGVTPFLKVLERSAQVGHYFIDIKDFTRQTEAMKEEGMAEIIRKEFYLPILDMAREYYHDAGGWAGSGHSASRGAVSLGRYAWLQGFRGQPTGGSLGDDRPGIARIHRPCSPGSTGNKFLTSAHVRVM